MANEEKNELDMDYGGGGGYGKKYSTRVSKFLKIHNEALQKSTWTKSQVTANELTLQYKKCVA